MRRVAALVVTAAVGAGAGLGLAPAGGDDPPPMWHPTPTNSAVPATSEQEDAYAVLASTQRVQDVPNARVEELATRAGIGYDPSGARIVGSTDAGPIWLIPANGGLCLGLEDSAATAIGATCESSDDVIARGTTIGDGAHIYGIAPDGVDSVTVTPAAGGATSAVPVTPGGVYTLPFASATIAVDGPSGVTEFDVLG